MSGAWVCDPCARRHGLNPNAGGSFSGGGWCAVGQHQLPFGQRVVWHASVPAALLCPDVSEAAPPTPAVAAILVTREPEQLELL